MAADGLHRAQMKTERAIVARYRGGIQTRMILTFVAFSAAWTAVLALGISGTLPIWLGLIINTALASTFYMPLHEAIHGNIWGSETRARWGEDLIGTLSSIPLGFDYKAHRATHLRHHAHTNNPDKNPDHYTSGSLLQLTGKWVSLLLPFAFLPVFAFIPVTQRILPAQIRHSIFEIDTGGTEAGLKLLRYWAISHGVLVASFVLGFGWPVLLLWYVPARLQALWLLIVFAWFPHHPADDVGRYVDTRVAAFPGSTFLSRGHDHHALHHLYPRVPHYRLRALWQEMADDLVAKGVRAEGSATAATGPVIWR